jgi:hypothetical protein
MSNKSILKLQQDLDNALYKLDHFLCGVTSEIEVIDFNILFSPLIAEVTKDKNVVLENLDMLGNYYSMSEMLNLSRKNWMYSNDDSEYYEAIDEMCSVIGGCCQDTILRILEIHDPDSFVHIDDSNFSIQSYLKTTNQNDSEKILTLKPTYMGISLDLQALARKASKLLRK